MYLCLWGDLNRLAHRVRSRLGAVTLVDVADVVSLASPLLLRCSRRESCAQV